MVTGSSPEPSATPPPVPEAVVVMQAPPPGIGKALLLCAIFYGATIFATMIDRSLRDLVGITLEQAVALFFELLFAWALTLWISTKLLNRSWNVLYGVGPFPKVYAVPTVVAGFGLSIVLSEAATLIPMSDFVKQFFTSLFTGNPVFMFLGVCVLAPITEELFFRGFVLRSFLQRYSARKAVLVSSLLFAVFHLNPWQAVVAFPIGLLNAVLLLRTGSLIPGMLVHFAVNFTSVFLLVALGGLFGYNRQQLIDNDHMPWEMMLIGVAFAVSGLVWLFKLKPRPSAQAWRGSPL